MKIAARIPLADRWPQADDRTVLQQVASLKTLYWLIYAWNGELHNPSIPAGPLYCAEARLKLAGRSNDLSLIVV